MLSGVETGKGAKRGQSRPASIHICLRLENSDRKALPTALCFAGAVAASELRKLPAGGESIGEAEPGVVPGVLVLRAGIPQAHDRMQRLSLRFGFALFQLRLPDELG